ncbi:hypothetical protein MNV49_002916 [Pseudohyphozyma bogoriensis]|nr:hypothetical protein MNV49_002916 [Pseudohyphozyma bogoriensis]
MLAPAALLFLASYVAAQSAVTPLTCGAGQIAGYTTSTIQFNNTLAELEAIVGQFSDNAIGSARNISFGGVTLAESLIGFNQTSPSEQQIWELAVPVDWTPYGLPLVLNSYHQNLTISELCGGAASQAEWTIDFCITGVNVTESAYAIFNGSISQAFASLTSMLGNTTFTGCPTSLQDNTTSTSTSVSTTTITSAAGAAVQTATGTASSVAAATTVKSGAAAPVSAGKLSFIGLLAFML